MYNMSMLRHLFSNKQWGLEVHDQNFYGEGVVDGEGSAVKDV